MRQLKISKSITNRSSEALDKYLVEIGREPMVSIDEEIELAQKIRKGGREGERAKDKLVKANLHGRAFTSFSPKAAISNSIGARSASSISGLRCSPIKCSEALVHSL